MGDQDLDIKMQNAFNEGLKIIPPVDYTSLEFAKSTYWDSVAHLQLIAAIENQFDIMLDTSDVLDLSSYEKALKIVKKYVTATS